jgi:hypothetical protein
LIIFLHSPSSNFFHLLLVFSLYLLIHHFSLQSDRMKQVQQHLDTLNALCLVLGMDFKHTVSEVHPSFGDSGGLRDISNLTIQHLATTIHKLREVKIQRMQKVTTGLNFSQYLILNMLFQIDHVVPLCHCSSKILQLQCWSYGI